MILFKNTLDRAAEAEYKERVLNTFKQPPLISDLNENLVPRPDVERLLSKAMTHESDRYFLISGGHGVGKTTAVKSSLHNLGKDGGCVYIAVDVANPAEIWDQLDAAFTPTPKRASHLRNTALETVSNRPIETKVVNRKLVNTQVWHFVNSLTNDFIERSLMGEIVAGAKEYKKEFKKRPVLVIDDVNFLAKDCPEILTKLQRWAKRCADDQALGIIFVSSDGLAPQQLSK